MTEDITTEDHGDGHHVTDITVEDPGNRHHVIDITMTQQQPGDPRPAGELNQINRQDHRMIDIEELLND